jgi:hypothetical protein
MRDLASALVPFASDAAREYWSAELAFPSTGRTPDIAQPPVSPQRLTPFRTTPPPPDSASEGFAGVVNLSESEVTQLPQSSPPPARSDTPHTDAEDLLARANRSARRRLVIWTVLCTAAVMGAAGSWIFGGQPGSNPTHSAASDPERKPAENEAIQRPVAERAAESPSRAAQPPANSSSSAPLAMRSAKAARVAKRAPAAVAKQSEKPTPVRAAAEPAARTALAQEPTAKVRVIDDSAPKVQVIE